MKKHLSVFIVSLILIGSLFGGGQEESAVGDGSSETVWLEVWRDSSAKGPMERDYPQSVFFQEEFGVGIYGPQIAWNGGKDYAQRLQLNVAAGDIPDMFQPVNGLEYDLAEQGALMPLDELLPKYAPELWNRIPESVWNIVRANSPDGKIYYIPKIWEDLSLTGFIRTDWLDRVGMDVPTTIEEYKAVLRAFKEQDANGNGDPNDELPTTGRQDASWMDHLFAPFGVAISEGRPEWHTYNGELTYSAVTPNMKAALAWIADLYQDDLLDRETLLNSKKMWDGKVKDNRVGSWFYGAQWVMSRLVAARTIDPELDIAYLPVLKAPGFDGFYTRKAYQGPFMAFSAESEKKVIGGLKILNYLNDPGNIKTIARGYEGVNYELKDGKESRISLPPNTQDPLPPAVTSVEGEIQFRFSAIEEGELLPLAEMITEVMRDIENVGIDGQGIPVALYEGYPDIENHTLYKEYASLIILGEYDIDKFDEFVEKWYASGGAEVTERVRDWYAEVQK